MEEGGMLRRLLGHGDLRFVILALLEEKPRHGYELIKALEEKSFGHYTPSPGVIYPTLTFLEEGGYASASTEDNKKLYTLTEEGKVLLDENRDFVEAILNRMARVGEKMSKLREWFGRDEGFGEKEDKGDSIRHAMHRLRAELFPFVEAGKEQRKKIIEIIEQAAAQIRALRG
jgi:DNA-binding PadR family transcriptional regulator